MYWTRIKGIQHPRVQNEFCKRARWQVVYIDGKKLLPELEGWIIKMMQVLNNRSIGSTDRVHNVILFTKRYIEQRHIQLRNTVTRSISGCLEVRTEGKKYQFGTIEPVQDLV